MGATERLTDADGTGVDLAPARCCEPTSLDPSPPEDVDAVDVLRNLGDLFILGILSTSEYETMLELTERLFGVDIALSA